MRAIFRAYGALGGATVSIILQKDLGIPLAGVSFGGDPSSQGDLGFYWGHLLFLGYGYAMYNLSFEEAYMVDPTSHDVRYDGNSAKCIAQ